MALDVSSIALEAAQIAINPSDYILRQIVDATSKEVKQIADVADQGVAELRIETEKQELQMRMAEALARVAQEVAIAKRIETAEEVEIEEFYDYRGEGHVGAKFDDAGVSVGAAGAGRRVSKRVYKFRGYTSITNDADPSVM